MRRGDGAQRDALGWPICSLAASIVKKTKKQNKKKKKS